MQGILSRLKKPTRQTWEVNPFSFFWEVIELVSGQGLGVTILYMAPEPLLDPVYRSACLRQNQIVVGWSWNLDLDKILESMIFVTVPSGLVVPWSFLNFHFPHSGPVLQCTWDLI